MSDIPAEIMQGIRESAAQQWRGDANMQEYMIGEETAGYLEYSTADFGAALTVKNAIIREALEYSETWEDRARHVRDEIKAFASLQTLARKMCRRRSCLPPKIELQPSMIGIVRSSNR